MKFIFISTLYTKCWSEKSKSGMHVCWMFLKSHCCNVIECRCIVELRWQHIGAVWLSIGVSLQTVELLLLMQYSGAGGLAAGYCRQCSLSLSVDILPVLYITDWSAADGDRLAYWLQYTWNYSLWRYVSNCTRTITIFSLYFVSTLWHMKGKVENRQFVPTVVSFNALAWGDPFWISRLSRFCKKKESSGSPSVK